MRWGGTMEVLVPSTSDSFHPNMRSAAGFHMEITRSRSRAMIATGAAWITARSSSALARVSLSRALRWVMSTRDATMPAISPPGSRRVALFTSTSRCDPSAA